MPFLTIFTAPKPFTNPHIAIIQRNAIQSWKQLGKDVSVLLLGDEPGLAEAAHTLGVRHLPGLKRSPQGTPLVSHIFELARLHSDSPLMVFANADMLLMPDLVKSAIEVIDQSSRFLVVGQRWDLDVKQPLSFGPGWDESLRRDVRKRGRLHAAGGSDYFIYPRDCFADLPEFAIGRAGWDNWMIYHARAHQWDVIDATPSIMAVHQDHDYSHLPGGQSHYNLEESDRNRLLAGGKSHMYILLDANKRLVEGRLRRPPRSLSRLLR
ncbi:MAG: hypothetical protein EHM39_01930, partial [Chloroflexi bacterium]